MKIEASDKGIQEVFSLGYFKIPRFQRPYSWEDEEVGDFWNDIIKDKTDNYFIGSMVVYLNENATFGVVDGQQRLTTITLLLSAIRGAFIKLGESDLAQGLHAFIERSNINNKKEFILKSETSYPYLQSKIQSFEPSDLPLNVGSEEKLLESAYALINSFMIQYIPYLNLCETIDDSDSRENAVEKLIELRKKILSLKLVFIQLDNEKDAYLIFETLNARGRDLKTSDLVKNLLLKILRTDNTSFDHAKESWVTLINNFNEIQDQSVLDSFLLHYWISEHEYCTAKQLFNNIDSYISGDIKRAKDLLSKLVIVSKLYCKMMLPLNSTWKNEEIEVRDKLANLKMFSVKQQYSIILALLRCFYENKITLKQLKINLNKIEHFYYVFSGVTSSKLSGSVVKHYSKLAVRLTNPDVSKDEIQSIFKSLSDLSKEHFPSYEEFRIKFANLIYLSDSTRNKKIIKLSLYRVLGDNVYGLDLNYDALTLEHLIPQSQIKSKDTSRDIVGSIGNILLLNQKVNSEVLRDLSPTKKIKKLKELKYPLYPALINETEWTSLEVQERTNKMAHKLYYSVQV